MGHDAAVTVVIDGVVQSLIEKERHTRIKHAAIATVVDIDLALADAGIGLESVDAVAVTTTQNWPFLFVDPGRFRFEYAPDLEGVLGGPDFMRQRWAAFASAMMREEAQGRKRLVDFHHYPDTAALFDADTDPSDPKAEVLFARQFPFTPTGWSEVGRPDRITANAAELYGNRDWRELLAGPFHAPIRCTIRGRTLPGAVIPHHLAHAATAFYQSDAERAAVVTYDGGYQTGVYGHAAGIHAVGEGGMLYPIWFNHSHAGNLYRRVADACGLKGMGGPGKLMGLAPYGTPRFHDPSFVGTMGEVRERYPWDRAKIVELLYETAWPYIRNAAALARDEVGALPAPDPLARFPRDMAASVQLTFEEQALGLARTAARLAADLGVAADTLCLSGGCALNCPANSRIWHEAGFARVFVPPSCDDSGLAIGAAFYVAHALFKDPRVHQGADTGGLAYLGRRQSDGEVDRAVRSAGNGLRVEERIDAPAAAAADVAEGAVVGWFEGRSEIGPRALGHRSIVADPRDPRNLNRVNDIKSRERWRPLAPAVLVERHGEWFAGGPPSSPHMLFTARVRSDALPAITHVDGSARVQTVDDSASGFRKLIEAFETRTGTPVVMNTSLNGRGEPIVENPADALDLFRSSGLDVLYLEGRRVCRRKDEPPGRA
ncbi:carbamoyltransferase C-terminal domain-containing protein [Thalassobaculum sp.]|uniref:carbamoyltransferase C-terminal domain-containing protein n=1 Tax=Thalassobaculum sp. TaxID=2022740 RepID=UPI0032EDD59C